MTTLRPRTMTYRVKHGDCLWNIAKEQYGDPFVWPEIFKHNKIQNANLIFIGQTLTLPSVSKGKQAGSAVSNPPNVVSPKPTTTPVDTNPVAQSKAKYIEPPNLLFSYPETDVARAIGPGGELKVSIKGELESKFSNNSPLTFDVLERKLELSLKSRTEKVIGDLGTEAAAAVIFDFKNKSFSLKSGHTIFGGQLGDYSQDLKVEGMSLTLSLSLKGKPIDVRKRDSIDLKVNPKFQIKYKFTPLLNQPEAEPFMRRETVYKIAIAAGVVIVVILAAPAVLGALGLGATGLAAGAGTTVGYGAATATASYVLAMVASGQVGEANITKLKSGYKL